MPQRRPELVFQGVPASPGIALAQALRLESSEPEVEERAVPAHEVEGEVRRFERAVDEARAELQELRETTRQTLGEEQAAIFDAHLAMLSDPLAVEETIAGIRTEGRNAESLFRRNLGRVVESLEKNGSAYFSERAADIRDVKRRVLRRLTNAPPLRGPEGSECGIVVAHELAPSEAAVLDPQRVLGLAVDDGSTTSHVAIMARSRGIPAVVGLRNMCAEVRTGDMLAIDGFRGSVIVNPGPEALARFTERQRQHRECESLQRALVALPALTLDGREIILAANMETPADLDLILERGAAGIGLFRTEFFFMHQHRLPTEEEQFVAYRGVAERVAPHAAIIRTLDVGGDKFASYLGADPESNPFLGVRGIRFLMDHPDLLRTQLRATLRASAFGRVKLLLPMISGLEELRAARHICAQVMSELTAEGLAFDPHLELGIMIEVPSTALMADIFAEEADFFSIGSNDLIQYLLAVDRGSASVAHLYEPFHPAVLRAIHQTVTAAHARGRWVGLCGEMAADPRAALLLVGLGLDELSVGPYLVPEIKRIIRGVDYAEAAALATRILALGTAEEVRATLEPVFARLFPDLIAANGTSGSGSPAAGGFHA